MKKKVNIGDGKCEKVILMKVKSDVERLEEKIELEIRKMIREMKKNEEWEKCWVDDENKWIGGKKIENKKKEMVGGIEIEEIIEWIVWEIVDKVLIWEKKNIRLGKRRVRKVDEWEMVDKKRKKELEVIGIEKERLGVEVDIGKKKLDWRIGVINRGEWFVEVVENKSSKIFDRRKERELKEKEIMIVWVDVGEILRKKMKYGIIGILIEKIRK